MEVIEVDYKKLTEIASQFEKIKIYPTTEDFCKEMAHCFYIEWEDLSGPVFQYLNATGKEKYTDKEGEKSLEANEWCVFWVSEEGGLYRLDPEFQEIKYLQSEAEFGEFLKSLEA
jgi:hypothetical protein